MFYPFFSSNKLYSSFCSQFQGHFPLLPSQHEVDQVPLPKAPMPLYFSFIALTLTYDHLLVTLCVSYLSLPPFLQIWSSWWEVYAYFAHCCYTITLHSRLAQSRNLINIHGRKEWRRKEASNGRKKVEVGERREQRGSCKDVMGEQAMCNTQNHHWELICGGILKENTDFFFPFGKNAQTWFPF